MKKLTSDLPWHLFKLKPFNIFRQLKRDTIRVLFKSQYIFEIRLIDIKREEAEANGKEFHRCKICQSSRKVSFSISVEFGTGYICYYCKLKYKIHDLREKDGKENKKEINKS